MCCLALPSLPFLPMRNQQRIKTKKVNKFFFANKCAYVKEKYKLNDLSVTLIMASFLKNINDNSVILLLVMFNITSNLFLARVHHLSPQS